MSPELNGNPPVLIKRKKNRDKKHASTSKINDFNAPSYNYFQGNLNSYPNVGLNEPYYAFPPSYPLPAEPMSLPIYPTYPNIHLPMNIPYNGNIHHKLFKMPEQSDTNDYMSLPVVNGDQAEDTGQRRFSDPGLPNESDSSYNSSDSQVIQSLTQQISILKENNRKLNREVTELRMELNLLKHQQSATRHYERDYEPGMISDIIREIRDAARIREDALLAKVKHMVEEKQLSMGQFHLVSEKNRNSERLSKLEEQMKSLALNTSRSEDNISLPVTSLTEENAGSARQVAEMEREALLLRRELQDARARKEESDQKILQLDKRISNLLRPKDLTSETSDDGKTSISTPDTLSVTTQSSIVTQSPHRITLSGPVTDL